MVERLDINPNILSYYIEQSTVPMDYLQTKFKDIDAILDGSKKPTFNQLSKISQLINVPTGLLLLSDTVNANKSILKFRTINSDCIEKASSELKDTIVEMKTKQDFLKNEIDYKLKFVGEFSITDDYLRVVNVIRKYLNISTSYQKEAGRDQNALKYFRNKISQMGIFVFFNSSVKNNTHRSLSVN